MDLCAEWVNVADGAVYGKVEGELKNCINMLSHLGCYQGGIIFPLNTGQGESEEDIIEEIFNIKEEILRLLEEEGLQSVDAYMQRIKTDNPDVDKFLELLAMRENSGSYIASYHLVGNSATNDAFNGKKTWKETDDGNGVSGLTYMAEMGGLDLSILFGGIE